MIVKTFKPRFAPLVEAGKKTQTIRPVPKRKQDMPKVGQEISLRTWTGRPYASKQRVLRSGIITSVSRVRIGKKSVAIFFNGTRLSVLQEYLDGFAVDDGFRNWAEMREWFAAEHGLPFAGILIQWKNK